MYNNSREIQKKNEPHKKQATNWDGFEEREPMYTVGLYGMAADSYLTTARSPRLARQPHRNNTGESTDSNFDDVLLCVHKHVCDVLCVAASRQHRPDESYGANSASCKSPWANMMWRMYADGEA